MSDFPEKLSQYQTASTYQSD